MAPANHSVLSSSETPPQTEGDDGGGKAGLIAAGVTVPIIVILLVVAVAYCIYRKKYPVRMIVGRDFKTFYNPAYGRKPPESPKLVREDAESFFQQTQPTGLVTLTFGENGEEPRVAYINTGFEYDSQDADEEEVEKRFRQQKAYLFRKDDLDEADQAESMLTEEARDLARNKKKTKSKVNGEIHRDRGHDNAAFSGDSDAESGEGKHSEETPSSNKDKTDAGSTSSEVSGASKAEAKEDTAEDGSAQPTSPSSTQMMPDPSHHPGSMTVRDFLLLAKEKRALSDVQRVRADSLIAFEFDIKKSARRRAQSAGDIWASAVQASPSVTREKMLSSAGDAPSDDGMELQADSNAVHEINENLADNDGKTADDGSEVIQPESHTDVKAEEADEEEEERKVHESGMEESYVVVDEAVSGSNESLPHAKDNADHSERYRTDSSTSDSSYEKVVPAQASSDLQSASHDSDSGPAQQEEDADSSLKPETAIPVTSPEGATCPEDDPVMDTAVRSSSPPTVKGTSESLGPSTGNTEGSAELTENLDDVQITKNDVDISASVSAPGSSNAGLVMDESGIASAEPIEEFPLCKQSPGTSPDEPENVSPSSSLVMLDRNDVEDLDAKDDDSDIGSFKMGASIYANQLSVEDEDFDKIHLEQESMLNLGVADQPPSTGVNLQAHPAVHVLSSLTYSDHSSLSSNDGDGPEKELADASRQQEPSWTGHATSKDVAEPAPPHHTFPEHPSLPSDAGYPLESTAASGSELVHSTVPESTSSPQSSPGLAALRLHPDTKKSSESDAEDVELTDEDIQLALEASDDSSEELHVLQPPQTSPGRKVPVKIPLTDKIVFSEESDDDDVDV